MPIFTEADLAKVSLEEHISFSKTASYILKKEALKFSSEKTYDIFVSHSYSDANEILKLRLIIEEMGYEIYVDWIEDRELDRSSVSKETADLLRRRMKRCKSLFYVKSKSSRKSTWMPWELGYFDGLKSKVAILPIVEKYLITDKYVGLEYLGLYPYISKDRARGESSETLWIHESSNKYVSFDYWLQGKKPYIH